MTDVDIPPVWRRAAACESLACVEVAWSAGQVLVRDAKRPGAGFLTVTAPAWRAFCAAVVAGTLAD